METIFMSIKNSKANEPHKFVPTLQRQLDLKSLNKHLSANDLSDYYAWKNIYKKYSTIKLNIKAPT